jgi:hypothetical protein
MRLAGEKEVAELAKRMQRYHGAVCSLFQFERMYMRAQAEWKSQAVKGCLLFFSAFFS